jgi:hypothetical protein
MGMTAKEIAATHVTYREGIAVEAVSHLEVAFVIGAPDIVGFPGDGLRTARMLPSESFLIGCNETFAFEDIGCRGDCREIAVMASEDLKEFLRPPGGVLASCCDESLDDRLVGEMGTRMGASRLVRQSARSAFLIALHPLIAGFPADTELETQLIESEIVFQVLCDETHSLVHDGNSFPTHRHLLQCL